MLKVVAFMKQVAKGLQMEGNFGTAHVYRSSLNAIIAYRGKGDFTFHEVTPEWLKGFEIHLRGRGCSWNTVSTYLRTFRAVYNRAVDCRGAVYVPHLFRSVYTGTRADRKRALCDEDMQKVFAKLPSSPAVTPAMRRTQELFVLMFLLRGLPFVDLAYLRKSDLHDNVITYRRRKTGRPLSVTLTREAMVLLKRYMNRDSSSPYLFSLLESREGTKEAYREYQLALRSFNQQLLLLYPVQLESCFSNSGMSGNSSFSMYSCMKRAKHLALSRSPGIKEIPLNRLDELALEIIISGASHEARM